MQAWIIKLYTKNWFFKAWKWNCFKIKIWFFNGKSFKTWKFRSEDIYQSIQFLPLSSNIQVNVNRKALHLTFSKVNLQLIESFSWFNPLCDFFRFSSLKKWISITWFYPEIKRKNRSNLSLWPSYLARQWWIKHFPLRHSSSIQRIESENCCILKNYFKFGYFTSYPAHNIPSFDFENINYLWSKQWN
jgi:hypothetical protein